MALVSSGEHTPSNAGLEWQARSHGWQSPELMAACQLEGLVRSVAQQTTSGILRIFYSTYVNSGLTNGIICNTDICHRKPASTHQSVGDHVLA